MKLETRVFYPDNKTKRFKIIRSQGRVLIQANNNKIRRVWFAMMGTHRTKEFVLPNGTQIKDGVYSIPEKQFSEITKHNLYLSKKKRNATNAEYQKRQNASCLLR